jgi:hypothetical protein
MAGVVTVLFAALFKDDVPATVGAPAPRTASA